VFESSEAKPCLSRLDRYKTLIGKSGDGAPGGDNESSPSYQEAASLRFLTAMFPCGSGKAAVEQRIRV